MEFIPLIKQMFGIRYHQDKKPWQYGVDVFFHLFLYILAIILVAVLVTLLAFGYVSVEDGGYDNPFGTIAYVWAYGLLPVTIPLGIISLAINLFQVIKTKRKSLTVAIMVYALALIIVNVALAFLDVVALVEPWFAFLG
jgi:ABC-type transport system involved in multi-copper enzyme maturation permease subunit